MIAAIYARKSTDQSGVTDDQKSVARQIEHARQYAERKGWTVLDDYVFVDDGISGAEFKNRHGFLRLMNAVKPRAPFQALVMSEESRLGREAIEAAYALKQLVQAGVRVWFYLEDRERTLDSPTDKIMLSLTAFADELEREKARQRTYDAMQRKARAGHVTGGRVFGYDNHEIVGADGRRSHVERRINQAEAGIVRRIFELASRDYGLRAIVKTLNADAAPTPRPQQQRPKGWKSSTVREVLYRELYRGRIVWNRTRKRNSWGQVQQHARPDADLVVVESPDLRIVSDKLWNAVHALLAESRAKYLRGTHGQLWGRPARGAESKYLLPGLARCGICNGSLYVKSRDHGRKRAYFYGCTSYHLRGSSICPNSLEVPMTRSDQAVLDAIDRSVLRPEIAKALRSALEKLSTRANSTDAEAARLALTKRLATVEKDLERLTAAVTAGGDIPTLIDALKAREAERAALQQQLREREQIAALVRVDVKKIERELTAKLDDWKALLRRQVPQARQVLKKLLCGPIRFSPQRDEKQWFYDFSATIAIGPMLAGTVFAMSVASPAGFPLLWTVEFEGLALRRAA
jgi:DNA invertase Pin-like site-specific DNA recombinase